MRFMNPFSKLPLKCACLALVFFTAGCRAETPTGDDEGSEPYANLTFSSLPKRIAFGSCSNQNAPKPVLDLALQSKPDLFVFLGDNIYADTDDMAVMRQKYEGLNQSPEFKRLKASVPFIATCDDHDYGRNDAGESYPFKKESREIFLDFWEEPADSPRRSHAGIYTSYFYEEHGRILQIIVLDERTWRSELGLMLPRNDPAFTMLGADQWAWLKTELLKPATVRIIASSTQFGHTFNGYESWTNMPLERQKMIALIAETRAEGVVFISGDVHWGEISRQPVENGYDLWDITSSGITEEWREISRNQNRVGDAVAENHYGFLEIDWKQMDPDIHFGLVDVTGALRTEQTIRLSDLRSK